MKKLLLLAAAGLMSISATYAQTETQEPNRVIIHAKDGTTHVFNFADLDYMDFDYADVCSLTASVVPGSVTATSFSLYVEPSAGCASYSVVYAEIGGQSIDKGNFSGAKTIEFTGLTDGKSYAVTITPFDKYSSAGEAVNLSVTVGTPAPKIGDYFYSDGTWSDGGLISIDVDGRNAVWAATKPAPVEGKTVIGIVCVTDPNRIAPEDKADGYTHGYVIGCRNIVDPDKDNYTRYPESIWYGGHNVEIEVTSVTKAGTTCYNRVSGRQDTREIMEYYGDGARDVVPLFYRGTTANPTPAPENTSGWFIPSMGQLWDCVANFCSGKVADKLYEWRTLTSDITYYGEDVDQPVFADFNRVFSKIPASDKDEFTISDGDNPKCISIHSCNRYNNESAVHFNLGQAETGSLIEVMAGWWDEEAHGRAFLAF